MKVLWITNMPLPDMQKHLGGDITPYGGWLSSAAQSFTQICNIELAVASVSGLVNNLESFRFNGILHFAIPLGRGNLAYNKEYEKYWIIIKKQFSPDLVHIHGTEFSHGLSYVKVHGGNKVVVSIQGLLSGIERYSAGGLSKKEIIKSLTIRDLITKSSVFYEKKSYSKRSIYEIELLKHVNYVIGRTSWDRAHVWAINPHIKYFVVNETLRSPFYEGQWQYEQCTTHSIFLSQAGSALKGAHWVLRALPFVLYHYPDTKVVIAGKDVINNKGPLSWIKQTNYAKLLKKLIDDLNLWDNIECVGVLSAEEMKKCLLNSNLFICPSSIENSPNSLGEAQILGVPCLASYVGGVPDMMRGFENNLYRFDDIETLAIKICEVFDKKSDQVDMSLIAKRRHNRTENARQLQATYKAILEGI